MPYEINNPPDQIRTLPKEAQAIWIDVLNKSIKKDDEQTAHKKAWAAIKKGYKKDQEGKWVKTIDSNYMEFTEEKGWFAVFRTGTHTDSQGRSREWTEADLDEIVTKYNPKEHEAPIVIGHPKENAPAWGWVETLKRVGNTLFAKASQLVPEFKDWVNEGLYKKRSISLYPDMTLKHIGFLGATPPAVKGLPDTCFKEKDGAYFVEYDIEQKENTGKNGGYFKMPEFNFKERLKGLFNKAIDDLPDNPQEAPVSYSESEVNAKITEAAQKARDEERKKAEKEFSEKAAKKARDARKQELEKWYEDKLKQGAFIPAWGRLGLKEFIMALDAETEIEFSEGNKKSLSAWFQEFLEGLPKILVFKEVASTDGNDFSQDGNASAKLDILIKKEMEKDDTSFSDAFNKVQKAHPELVKEYQTDMSALK